MNGSITSAHHHPVVTGSRGDSSELGQMFGAAAFLYVEIGSFSPEYFQGSGDLRSCAATPCKRIDKHFQPHVQSLFVKGGHRDAATWKRAAGFASSVAIRVVASIGALAFCLLASCQAPRATAVEAARTQTAPLPANLSASRRTPVVMAVHNVLPAVVNIQTEATIRPRAIDPFFGFFEQPYRTQSVGSGFVWASDGIIVTNAHVIEGASTILANLYDGRQLRARVIGVDPDSDLAVLQVDARNLPAATIGTSSDLLIGETVIAVGNPFGLSGSVTTGVVSATGRSVPSPEQGRTYTDFIQTDASINPGNSGGPLLNIEAKVIGINVAIYAQAQNIGFAIPVDRARKIIEDLRQFGMVHTPWIGAVTATLTPEEARRLQLETARGALVTRIFSDSPADHAGLRIGDVIIGVGNSPVESREAFTTVTATAKGGSPLRLRIQRDGRASELTVVPVDPPRDLGLRILEQVGGIEVGESAGAVVISGVRRGSRADKIGLVPGDVIVAIAGTPINSIQSLNEQVTRSADRASIVLAIARGRYIYTLSFPMGT
jgi:serine protease Do